MDEFDLDLRTVEDQMDDEEGEGEDAGSPGRIVLGVLDGSTPDEEWIGSVDRGNVLVLAVEGDINERASGFAREVNESGGDLVHFRGFLIVSPPGIEIDTDRL